jgi:NADPH:quinone reductase-like Zn-dependent oxidoreductase
MKGRASFTLGGRAKPKYQILGCDVSGRVEAVGSKVTRFKPGDEVFGDVSGGGWGCFAEYVRAKEKVLALKSLKMSFEQAAAVPQAGVLALVALRDKGRLHPKQKVLINGAGGGVGTFGIQIVKAFGAEVTCVDRAEKLDALLSLGADHIIDYEMEDFAKNGLEYDLIIDVALDHSIFHYKKSLSPKGRAVVIGGTGRYALQALFLGPWMLGSRKVVLLLHKPSPQYLDTMNDLFESGKVIPIIDKVYGLDEIAAAFRYYAEGHFRGKIVIKVR